MRHSIQQTCAGLGVAVITGAVVGCIAGVAVSLPSGFVAWGGMLWSFIGAASLGVGFVGAKATDRLTSADARGSRSAGVGTICASAVFGGVTAALLLEKTASVTVIGGATFFALASAIATAGATRHRTRVKTTT